MLRIKEIERHLNEEVLTMYQWTDGTYISHHGILGQKWGVRRYQNEDGSLTRAGKAREKNRLKKELDRASKERDDYVYSKVDEVNNNKFYGKGYASEYDTTINYLESIGDRTYKELKKKYKLSSKKYKDFVSENKSDLDGYNKVLAGKMIITSYAVAGGLMYVAYKTKLI